VLLGTDCLEVLFGDLRTMVGNDTNTDMSQVRSWLTGAGECATILADHPEWDQGPQRLQVFKLEDQEAELTAQADHLSPQVWSGDLRVSGVNLVTCWRTGRTGAEDILKNARFPCHFDDMVATGNVDILCPLGKLVQNDGLLSGEEHEEDDLISISYLLNNMPLIFTSQSRWQQPLRMHQRPPNMPPRPSVALI
jgi:hypothetical protein